MENLSRSGRRLAVQTAAFVSAALLATAGLAVEATRLQSDPPAAAAPEPAPLRLAQAATERPVTFTDAQAARGEVAYTAACRDCHGANLDDGEFGGAPIKGSYFETNFGGAPASALFTYLSTAMPPDRPGQLGDSTYADITAYLLQRNGYPSGTQELPSNVEALDNLILTK